MENYLMLFKGLLHNHLYLGLMGMIVLGCILQIRYLNGLER